MLLMVVVLGACGRDNVAAPEAMDPWSGMPAHAWTQDPSERAIEIWTAEHGAPTEQCVEEVRATVITAMDSPELARECRQDTLGNVAGCLYQYDIHGAKVAIDEQYVGASHDVYTHELLHVLHYCHHRGDGNPRHTDAVWTHVPVAW